MLGPIVLFIATVTFGAFSWALKRHFASPRMPIAMVGLSVCSLAVFALSMVLIWFQNQDAFQLALSLPVYLASAALFTLSVGASRRAELRVAFDTSEPRSLLSVGPYRLIRHPFYTSYLLFWLACALATAWWPIWLALFVFIVIYCVAAIREEKSILASPLGAAYAAYVSRTGFMIPWVRL